MNYILATVSTGKSKLHDGNECFATSLSKSSLRKTILSKSDSISQPKRTDLKLLKVISLKYFKIDSILGTK
jgi:hypothetical protein